MLRWSDKNTTKVLEIRHWGSCVICPIVWVLGKKVGFENLQYSPDGDFTFLLKKKLDCTTVVNLLVWPSVSKLISVNETAI